MPNIAEMLDIPTLPGKPEPIDVFVSNLEAQMMGNNEVIVSIQYLATICYEPHRISGPVDKMLNTFRLPSKLDALDDLLKHKNIQAKPRRLYGGGMIAEFDKGFDYGGVVSHSGMVLSPNQLRMMRAGIPNVPPASGAAFNTGLGLGLIKQYIQDEIKHRLLTDLQLREPSL